MRRKILFVCQTNGVHSAMAEALLNKIDSEHFQAISAGRSPARPHPLTIEVMREIGIDLSQKASKHVDDVRDQEFDYVITLDEGTRRMDGNFKCLERIHWKFDDPTAASSVLGRELHAFRIIRDQISQRLRLFVIVHVRPQTKSQPSARQRQLQI
jgi:protein-tyrosine-phosphatase